MHAHKHTAMYIHMNRDTGTQKHTSTRVLMNTVQLSSMQAWANCDPGVKSGYSPPPNFVLNDWERAEKEHDALSRARSWTAGRCSLVHRPDQWPRSTAAHAACPPGRGKAWSLGDCPLAANTMANRAAGAQGTNGAAGAQGRVAYRSPALSQVLPLSLNKQEDV